MHNYPRLFLNPMHNEKNSTFILEKDSKGDNKNHTSDLVVLELNPHGEEED